MPEPLFTDVLQVALVVRDLDAAVRLYNDEYGIGPWQIMELPEHTIDDLVYDDEPAQYSMRIGTAMIGKVQWELIQPVSEHGPYADFLRTRGEGVHHIGMEVSDYDAALARLREKGHVRHIGGVCFGNPFAYVSTDRDLGTMTEIVDWQAGTPAPDSVYPPVASVQ